MGCLQLMFSLAQFFHYRGAIDWNHDIVKKTCTSADSSDSVLHGETLKTNTAPLIFKILSPCLRLDLGTECAWVFWA